MVRAAASGVAADRADGSPTPGRARPGRLALGLAAGAAAGMILAATVGLLTGAYPTAELERAFMANDVVTLALGLPLLAVAGWAATVGRREHAGVLVGLATLLFVAYQYLVYLVAMPLGPLTPVYAGTLLAAVAAAVTVVGRADRAAARRQLHGAVPARFGGTVLVVLGAACFVRAGGLLATGLAGAAGTAGPVARAELGLLVADVAVSGVWLAGGVGLWHRTALGYVLGGGALLNFALLLVVAPLVLALQPGVTSTPLAADLSGVLLLSPVCLVPAVLLFRAAARRADGP